MLPKQQPLLREGRQVKSPLVGNFYAAPAEDAPPFVSVGDAESGKDRHWEL